MVRKESRAKVRENKHRRLRNRISGTTARPRLAVFRSNNHMYAQIIDDTVGNTIAAASTLDKDIKEAVEKTNNVAAAAQVGTVIAKRALEKGITTVVFDRGGYIYQGKVQALADAAREAGLVVVGDSNGHVGAGMGKAAEIPEAIRKGKEDAMKKLITVKLDDNKSITHDILGKHTGATVLLKKSPDGTGIIAGGPARSVCELAGIKNIRTKSLGSNNKQNVVLATIAALAQLKSPEEVAKLRGKSVEEIVG